ncbi:protein kinase, putative [Bodo saltans]|uniref:Protein kinase, putative n=1 Tax=Bodo saltans TaxID=75058 RepID=A0A0S4IKT8_BODSA|nr:protein kinase, putative [Bodo saltans]|eukprot:CUE68761.1 protein kinase, putative [Bodo saltans]
MPTIDDVDPPSTTDKPPRPTARSVADDARVWLTSKNVDGILHDLVTSMVRDRPVNIETYAKDYFTNLMTKLDDARVSSDEAQVRVSKDKAEEQESESVPVAEGASEDVTTVVALPQEEQLDSQNPARAAEPDRRQSGGEGAGDAVPYDDALEPLEDRPSPEELSEKFPAPVARGIFPASLRRVGEGNYGYVLQGAVEVSHAHTPESEPTSTTRHQQSERYAIKVVPIRAQWTLDEAAATELISREAKTLLSATTESGSKEAVKDKVKCKSVALLGCRNPLSENKLSCARCALLGAHAVLQLHGPVCYDAETDALWIPLTWAPITLETCIQERRRSRRRSNGNDSTPYFSLDELRHVASQLLCALHFLTTTCGVVHLDVKPANVLLTHRWWPASSASSEPADNSGDEEEVGSDLLDNDSGGGGTTDFFFKPANVLLTHRWWPVPSEPADNSGDEEEEVGSDLLDDDSGGGGATVAAAASLLFPQLYLGDFGLIQHIGAKKCQLGDFVYMSPEIFWPSRDADNGEGRSREDDDGDEDWDQEDNDSPSTSTTRRALKFHPTHDVWSLGVLLLHMMEGEEPFTLNEQRRFEAMEDNYMCPSPKHTSAWPMELIHFLTMCFERDYNRRPTPHEMLKHPFLLVTQGTQ